MDSSVLKDSEDLIIQLRRIRLDIEGAATRSLTREKSNLSQYTVLAILEEQGELTMGVLAQHLGLAPVQLARVFPESQAVAAMPGLLRG